jgi:phage shock protein PspC (stress-responsive transcriptional regulator)
MTNQQHRLYRSQTNKIIAGVCGGFGEFLDIDVTIVRLVWILLTLLGGSGIIIYILAYFIIPLKPIDAGETTQQTQTDLSATKVFGIIFIIVGAVILLDNLDIFSFHRWWDMSWEYVFPSLLILTGIYFITKRAGTSVLPGSQESPSESGQKFQEQTTNPESSTNTGVKSKVLRRSITDKKFLGICGGVGEYFNIDPTIIRIGYVIFTILSGGVGVILYFLMYLIIPEGQIQISK